jgi:4-diphosphocytidyl-2-C-methyl-D-erythritol kinase
MAKKQKSADYLSSAKINLYLDIVQKRDDGYHEIRTIFSEIALFDQLNFILTKKDVIQILFNHDFVSLKNNLIYKVAVFIKQLYKVKHGVIIKLKKNIPIAGGLGGGSSNAATTIKALDQLWDLQLSNLEMSSIAARFGSDINFFLVGGTALGEGRGEVISPLPDIEIDNILLVNPNIEIPSSIAYEKYDQKYYCDHDWTDLIEQKDVRYCFNKLESGICRSFPIIDQTLTYMRSNGAIKAILSGSGATMIGFCPNLDIAIRLSDHFSNKNFWTCITKTIKRRTK